MTVRFGMLGSGFMAHTYAQCLAKHTTGAALTAVACGRRAPGLAAEYGVDAEPSVEALLARSDIDAVIVATPHSTHRPLVEQVARSGRHVYLEKPMGLDVVECDAMIAACASAGVHLTVNKVTRFRESPGTAKRLLDEGAIGTLRMIRITSSVIGYLPTDNDWAHDPAEGGAWLDMGAHLCDAIRWFTGREPASVFARIGDLAPAAKGDLLRSAMVQFTMTDGMPIQIWMSFEMPPPGLGSQSQWVLVGSDGIVDADAYGKVRLGRGDDWELAYEMPTFALNADVYSPVRLAAFAAQVQDLTDAIADGRPPVVTGEDGRRAIAMVEAALRSSASGEVVHFDAAGTARSA